MAEVRLERISKVFAGEVKAVNNLDLVVADGEFLVLLGPSGCGKTTALRMIAGLETPTSGRVFIGNRDVTDAPPGARDIAMVFQNYALYPHMTAYENMAFGMRMHKTPMEEIERRVAQAALILGIGHLLKRRPKDLSGGERQRVALGRALVRQPVVFLFDEPLSNLDARMRVQMRHEIVRIHREFSTTSIYVTHDQFEAMTMGDSIAVLRDGSLQQIGTPDQLYNEPANRFVAEFIGTPEINIVAGEVVEGKFVSDGLSFSLPANLVESVSGPVEIGIRPEAFRLRSSGGNEASFSGTIDRIESLGGEHHVYISSGALHLVAKFSGGPDREMAENSQVFLHFSPAETHFFDVGSGQSLISAPLQQPTGNLRQVNT